MCKDMRNIRKYCILTGLIGLLTAANLHAEVFSAQCIAMPSQGGAGDWSFNANTETWNQAGKVPGPSDEVWIDAGKQVHIYEGWHTVSKLEMRSNGGGAYLEISNGALEVTGIAKFDGNQNSIIVSGGNLNIYWAYGGIDGLRITAGRLEIEGANWDTIVNLSQSGGTVILHSLDLAGPGSYAFEYGNTGVLKVETTMDPKPFFAGYIDKQIVRPSGAEWVYGTESIDGTPYATLSTR